MKSSTSFIAVAVSALLLAGAGALYTLAGDTGERRYRDCVDLIRRIQQLSNQINMEMARVRTSPFADFDVLTAFSPRMETLMAELGEGARLIPDVPQPLLETVGRYVNAVEAKQKYIEQFKTSYSVVRNSTRYLPLAAANVTRRAEEVGDETLARVVAIVVKSMNLYLNTPSDQVEERMKGVIQELREASEGHGQELAEAMEGLTTHMEILLSRQAPMIELFHQATSDDMTDLGILLSRDLELQLSSVLVRAANYRHGLVAVAVLLVMFWVVLGVQRRTRALASSPEMDRSTVALRTTVSEPEAHGTDESPSSLVPSAESAVLYDVLVRRSGDVVLSMAQKALAHADSLHEIRQRNDLALPSAGPMPERRDDGNLDDGLDASTDIADALRRDVDGIADIAGRLASYSALPDGTAERVMVDVNACMDQVVAATGADRVADVSRRYGEVPRISASPIELRLLLTQVLTNSMQALDALQGRKARIRISTQVTGTQLSIAIIDNGPGVPAGMQKAVFSPFHTSRDGAMGIGLTVTADLVRRYQGSIELRSLPEQGTMTRIALPVPADIADQALPGRTPSREDED